MVGGTETPGAYAPNSVDGQSNVNVAASVAQSQIPSALPTIVSEDNIYRLTDLVNSDFKMPVTDKDFELTHE